MTQQQSEASAAVPVDFPRRRNERSVVRKSLQLVGELFLTAGIVLLLFVAWEFWWTNVEANASQGQAIDGFAREFTGPLAPPAGNTDYGKPRVSAAPGYGETIGIMYVPRFGADYSRPIVQGTGADVLDSLGLGHYEGTSMPGAAGNFAVAGHRQTHGAVLDNIHELVPGDRIYVQTKAGYYTYVYRNNQIVLPSRTDVLLPVPTKAGVQPRDSYLTMTSCNPRFGSAERFIAYSLLESWQPASAGPPSEIAALAAKTRGKA